MRTQPTHHAPADAACVLLAEPNTLAAAVSTRILTDAGHAVTHVVDGPSALQALRAGGYDLLITSWELPGDLSGAGLCAAVRDDEHTQGMQIVMLTGHSDTGHQVAALDAGADDYVVKPFEPAVLVARVRAALRVARMEHERNLALEHLRRREAAYRDIALEQASLRRVAATVAAARTPDDVFGLVAREVARVLGCDGGVVMRVAGDVARVVGAHTVHGLGDAAPRDEVALDGHTLLAGVVRAAQPLRVGRPGDDDDGPWVTAVGAPIRVAGALWGAVVALWAHTHDPPDDSEARLGRFADLVSLAIGNAEARREIADMALRDALTGLPNRRAFDDLLLRAVAHSHRTGAPLSLVLMDIDHFKRVNDTHGHQVGDAVLTEVGRRLTAAVRIEEPCARLGGEEFAWLLPGASPQEALVAAERVRAAVAGDGFPGVGMVTISAGIAGMDGDGDAEALYRRSDDALYAAKAAGRNRCVVAAATLHPV